MCAPVDFESPIDTPMESPIESPVPRPWILSQFPSAEPINSSDRRSPDIVALVEAALSIMGVRDSATVFGMNSHMRLQFYKENKKEKKLKAVKRRKKIVSKPADHAQPPPSLSLAFTRVEADILAAISSWSAKDPICQ